MREIEFNKVYLVKAFKEKEYKVTCPVCKNRKNIFIDNICHICPECDDKGYISVKRKGFIYDLYKLDSIEIKEYGKFYKFKCVDNENDIVSIYEEDIDKCVIGEFSESPIKLK